jgi:hypothetical protein
MPAPSVFKEFVNPVFVETGSYMGDGIQQALDAGFKRVISIELSDKYYEICRSRFSGDSRVSLVKGDSALVLFDAIKDVKERITFWLDGHHSCGDTALGVHWAPLIQELDAIKMHSRNDHTILIDDMRCWQEPNPVHGFYEPDVISALKRIREDYLLRKIDSPVAPKDVLVAEPPR